MRGRSRTRIARRERSGARSQRRTFVATSEAIVPLISSDAAGPLGIAHLPRLWTKLTLASAGKLFPGYDTCGDGFDGMLLGAFGLDRAKTIAFVNEKHPTYMEFEEYVKQNGNVTPETIAKHNAAIKGYNHSDELGTTMRGASGIGDKAVADAVRLNMVEDLDELHKQIHA
jgi:hypothetical protein